MIDIPTGRVAYVIIAFVGVLGTGEKLSAVPWRALTLDERDQVLVLNIDRTDLERAPGIDPDHWPDMADPSWAARLDQFYGAGTRY